MPYCAVYSCTKHRRKTEDKNKNTVFTFHSDKEFSQKWVVALDGWTNFT